MKQVRQLLEFESFVERPQLSVALRFSDLVAAFSDLSDTS
jgi:hypothetical protein